MNEAALIQSAQQGDLDAFNRLVLAYQDMVYQQAYRMLGEQMAAEDVAQEAFIRAYKSIRRYRGGSWRAWLLRIATNLCYDELRRRKRRPTISLEPVDEHEQLVESPAWMRDSAAGPELEFELGELAQAIQHCLEGLPPEFRSVVVLVDVQGMDYAEAAQVISRPVGTVRSRLARARARLRKCLQQSGELIPRRYRPEKERR
jgi:RNA polymerase sigma-70 factor (ECF subfamily)